jgi:hypothetical protein
LLEDDRHVHQFESMTAEEPLPRLTASQFLGMPMHQHLTPSTTVQPIESVAARLAREQVEDDAWEAARDAEIAGKYRGREYARTCLACPHLPPDDRVNDPDSFVRTICESKRYQRVMVHAREGCETCPYLPENYGKPVRGRVGGLDDWGDGPEEDLIRRARYQAWEATHAAC